MHVHKHPVEPRGAPQRRTGYRLVYPEYLHPTLQLGERRLPVADISECAVRVAPVPDSLELGHGQRVVLDLHLIGGTRRNLAGTVIRHRAGELVVEFDEGLEFELIAGERNRLLSILA